MIINILVTSLYIDNGVSVCPAAATLKIQSHASPELCLEAKFSGKVNAGANQTGYLRSVEVPDNIDPAGIYFTPVCDKAVTFQYSISYEKDLTMPRLDALDEFIKNRRVTVTNMNIHPVVSGLRWLADSLERGEVTWAAGGLFINKVDGGYTVQGELELAEVMPENDGDQIG